MSYVLNKVGVKIPYFSGKTVSGKSGDWYFYKVVDLIAFIEKRFGKPDQTFPLPSVQKLANSKGIVIFEVDVWDDATGHATVWDGVSCSDKCYFSQSKKAYLWDLKI